MGENINKMNETKRRIIEEARILFTQKGFENVTINEICQNAEISKHTFYYYFCSKEELLHPFCKLSTQWSAQLTRDIMKISSPLEQIWYIHSFHIEKLYEVGPEIIKSIFKKLVIHQTDEMKGWIGDNPLKDIENMLIDRAKECGEVRNHSDATILRHMLLLQAVPIIQYWAMSDGKIDLKNSLRCAFETILDVSEEKKIGDTTKFLVSKNKEVV